MVDAGEIPDPVTLGLVRVVTEEQWLAERRAELHAESEEEARLDAIQTRLRCAEEEHRAAIEQQREQMRADGSSPDSIALCDRARELVGQAAMIMRSMQLIVPKVPLELLADDLAEELEPLSARDQLIVDATNEGISPKTIAAFERGPRFARTERKATGSIYKAKQRLKDRGKLKP